MEVPLQIAFRNMKPSDAIAARVRERVSWLERFNGRLISCRVVIEIPHKHHRTGNLFHVRIDLRVPGREVVVNRRPDQHAAHRDLLVALHDAFDEARRSLEDYTRVRRRDVKRLANIPLGRVARVLRDDGGYGFIQTEDARELYFHSHSVINWHFDRLEEGMMVRYAEEMGEEGPQASTVEVIEGRPYG